ncbi:hypothetical protein NP233_g4324 [Leucocoprinus birnbaumii]|uniref:GST C-terminal domain-containing protein n=1 Tax=Leucocoprinus birnbaumii TaxID=56174 RepID=A0AAD5VXG7_9AGAR|nr:hypothetical protein NP233_g4324 [Leucocoprinus birnbaumii]
MTTDVPLTILMDVRDKWNDKDGELLAAVEDLNKSLGYKIQPEAEWPALWDALKENFPDKGNFVPSLLHLVALWYSRLNVRIESDDLSEWAEDLVEGLSRTCIGHSTTLWIKPSTSYFAISSRWDKHSGKFYLEIPRRFNAQLSQVSYNFDRDFDQLFLPPQEISKEDSVIIPSIPASRIQEDTGEWAEVTAEAQGGFFKAPMRMPSVESIPRPEDLLKSTTPHYLIFNIGVFPSWIQCSHEPTLQFISDYLKKHGKTNVNDSLKRQVYKVEIMESLHCHGVHDFLSIGSYMNLGFRGGHLFNPMLILAIIEGVLGYQRVEINGNEQAFEFVISAFYATTYRLVLNRITKTGLARACSRLPLRVHGLSHGSIYILPSTRARAITTNRPRLLLASHPSLLLDLPILSPKRNMSTTQEATRNSDITKQKAEQDGSFKRKDAAFRSCISRGTKFEPEAGRYHLYVSLACPWATRTLIMRKLKGLEDIISVSVVSPRMGADGWPFANVDDFPGADVDTLNNASHVKDLYFKVQPDYDGRFTVPVLWDKKLGLIVNNESSEIIRMLNTEFNHLIPADKAALDFYPEQLRSQIDDLNAWVYPNINNGVYRAGFATTQEAYETAVKDVFEALDKVEKILEGKHYLIGDRLTEADIRLWVTIIRFDPVYVGHFKCNFNTIRAGYPAINLWMRKLYWNNDAFKSSTSFDHIKTHYYWSHQMINGTRIVPLGPIPHILPL